MKDSVRLSHLDVRLAVGKGGEPAGRLRQRRLVLKVARRDVTCQGWGETFRPLLPMWPWQRDSTPSPYTNDLWWIKVHVCIHTYYIHI
jgi:hypothetical protein